MSPLTTSLLLKDLPSNDLKEVQTLLKKLGFYPGYLDGIYGPLTKKGGETWKGNTDLGASQYLAYISKHSWELLQQEAKQRMGQQHNFATKSGVIRAICYECNSQALYLKTQWAYVTATVQHETANTFKPLQEYGKGKGRTYGKPDPQTGKTYYGRGFVQLTWKANYAKYGKILGVDLVNNPDLACDPNVALFVLVHGFKHGTFTGKKLEDFVNNHRTDFGHARQCINGMDRATDIAVIANNYLKQL